MKTYNIFWETFDGVQHRVLFQTESVARALEEALTESVAVRTVTIRQCEPEKLPRTTVTSE